MSEATVHIPVLFNEVLEQLQPAPGGIFVDGTLGGGGHTRALAERVGLAGRVIAVDLDNIAVERASITLAGMSVAVANASYADIPEVLDEVGVAAVDGVLLDLGLSSDQLADAARGFSYLSEGELDMRFDLDRGEPAWRMIERLSEEHLANVIYQYGEERFSRRIAKKIVEQRRSDPIRTATQLAELVRSCVPRSRGHNIDPATRTFQALRIAVNGELDALQTALKRLPAYLKPGGRLAIISFHSLEDRIVKEAFRDDERLIAITRKPIVASEEESNRNPRARSAKLRVAERVAGS
ncbi:MAG: 16S rRNA (cytosine(1402)-N(4))-methyltransferase RsmH [Pirellula sp.]|nr:16S rRNA (cytosine(1402)-N(4))-methyltransferase RsmH [Pirellula sp.]